MALSARCGQQAASILRQRCLLDASRAASLRSFSSSSLAKIPTSSRSVTSAALRLKQNALYASSLRSQQLRLFSSCLHRLASEAPPSAESYLASGAVNSSPDLVDVKKVLVIGSGGLSIGQAGEFDYSGESFALQQPSRHTD